jgi:hypothetical protein
MEWGISVTSRTRLRGSLKDPIGMAISAPDVDMCPSQLEGSQVVVESNVFPIEGVMASRAIGTETSIVLVILLVAGVAILRRTLEALGMAALAGHTNMFPFKLKISQIVVKFCGYPAYGGVASTTLCAKLTIMGIIGKMAAFTLGGRTLETGYMAALTGHFDMFALQLEICQAVVKLSRYPALRIVAHTTLGTKFAGVGIIR